jgi:DNA-binding HxlR family transcriptional regulator
LTEKGLFSRKAPRAEYVLTDVGNKLRPVLKALFEWGQRHTKYRAVTT